MLLSGSALNAGFKEFKKQLFTSYLGLYVAALWIGLNHDLFFFKSVQGRDVTQLPLKPRPPAQKGRQIIAYLFACLFVSSGVQTKMAVLHAHMKACAENLFTDYICSWAITPGPAAVAGAPGRPPALSGSRQYLILCTRRLSLFLNFLVQPLHTTLVGSE